MLQKAYKKLNILRINKLLPFSVCLFINCINLTAQYKNGLNHDDSLALEKVIVEKYYVANASDYEDTTGGILPKGSVTYRIYIDMKPGYLLQVVYGNQNHELFIKTSTTFFNNTYCMAMTGFNISPKEINENTVALDSWLTMGAATRLHTGILKSDDKDGSILKKPSLDKSDGLTIATTPTFKVFNLDLSFFKDQKDPSVFSTRNGGWSALEGVKGPDANNRVLIAQLTTNGLLSFDINVQIGTPRGPIKFVSSNPESSEVLFKDLSYNQGNVE